MKNRDMENYRVWKRNKYAENVLKERARKLEYAKKNKQRVNELSRANYAKNKNKYLARAKLIRAVKNGTIQKPCKCSKCNIVGKIDGHHFDYIKPLEVIWLCRKCHLELHRGPRKELYSDW